MIPEMSAHTVRVYDRLWTPAETRGDRQMIGSLNADPTLFRLFTRASEQALHTGPLSIKTVRSGLSTYRFGTRAVCVHPGQLLIVPDAARYSTHIGDGGAHIVSLYFPQPLVAEALGVVCLPADRLLEGACHASTPMADFSPHHRTPTVQMARLLDALTSSQSAEQLTDLTMNVLQLTVQLAVEAVKGVSRAPASRRSVKRELFYRASLARDQIEDSLSQDISLTALARTACLSAFHLHRVFTSVFQESPAQMLRRRRIERACEWLRTTRRPIGAIARDVGFESESAFSRRFRMTVGLSPSAYRSRRERRSPAKAKFASPAQH